MNLESKGEIVIYKPKGQKAEFQVHLKKETVWLNLNQIAKLFARDKSAISRHLSNIFKTGELQQNSVVAKNATTASDGKVYQVEYYNLDAILSVGYRINSKIGTQFRIWATRILKDHIIKGYSINEKRLKEQNERLIELQKAVNLMGNLLEKRALDNKETAGLLKVITDYSYALTLLDQYDKQQLKIEATTKRKEFILTYDIARTTIEKLKEELIKKKESIGFFGQEKDSSFKSSLGAIYQTFDKKELYPSIEEKAAHLLYFVVKNHSFVDGNKRIGAFLFIWFLDANGILYTKDGKKRLGDNALVALTLMIAESNPREKDIIVKVIVNLINKNN